VGITRSLDHLDDRGLLELARMGYGEPFDALYRRHRRVVLTFLARRVSDYELAADLLAETFAALLLLVRSEERELPDTPIAWLLTTARRLVIDSYRRGRVEAAARERLRMRPLVIADADIERIAEIAAETDLLRELAEVLPPDQLAALRARVLDELDYPAIARQLRCSEAVVRQRVSRALRTLRERGPEGEPRDG
jgi:RNA polymerase sigma factor (sigma-70 family)